MKSGAAATSLRWRSRLSKEAVHHDDSRDVEKGKQQVVVEDYGLDNHDDAKSRRTRPQLWSRLWTLLSAVSSGVALYVLEVDLSWYTAVASSLNIFLCICLVYAIRRLRVLGSVRQQVNYARTRVNSLATQNERLYRQLHHLDGMHGRLESVQHDLTKLIGNNDAQRMVQAVQRWRVVQAELNVLLRQQVQQTIVQACLATDADENFELSAGELERLILRLQNMPGVQLNEAVLRRQLEMEDDRSVQAILRLLRRIMQDTTAVGEEGTMTTSRSINKSNNTIIQLNAAELCKTAELIKL